MIRLAQALDAPLMARLLQDFSDSIGGTTVVDPLRLERRIQRWPQVQAVDDVHLAFCELKARVPEREIEFSALFPRGASRGVLGPLAAVCAREALRQLQLPPHNFRLAQLADWRVWGEFLHGQDAARVPDGGRDICEAWRDYFALDGKTLTVRQQTNGTTWIAEITLGQLVAHAVGV